MTTMRENLSRLKFVKKGNRVISEDKFQALQKLKCDQVTNWLGASPSEIKTYNILSKMDENTKEIKHLTFSASKLISSGEDH